MKSLDGGATWTNTGYQQLEGLDVQKVVPSLSDPNTFLVAATSAAVASGGKSRRAGVYLATNGGASYSLVLKGEATDIVADPGNAMRFYAAIADVGVFVSNNGGQTWMKMNGTGNTTLDANTRNGFDDDRNGMIDDATESVAHAMRIKLAISSSKIIGAGTEDTVYAALIGETKRAMAVFYSTDAAMSWQSLPIYPLGVNSLPDINPGLQGDVDFGMVADPNNANTVFISGDREVAAPYQGVVWKCDWSQAPASAWELVTSTGAKTATPGGRPSAPHADSRSLVFTQDNNILESDDGGVYELVNPYTAATRQWFSKNGNLNIGEFYSVGYDATTQTYFGGLQDNGVVEQPLNHSTTWSERATSYAGLLGDGGIVQADGAYRYSTGYNFNNLAESTWNAGSLVTTYPAIAIANSNVVGIRRRAPSRAPGSCLPRIRPSHWRSTTRSHSPHSSLSSRVRSPAPLPAPHTRILIGTSWLYESFDDGKTLFPIGGLANAAGVVVPNGVAVQPNPADSFGTITAMVYGGMAGATAMPDIAYVAAGRKIWVRTALHKDPTVTRYSQTSEHRWRTTTAARCATSSSSQTTGHRDIWWIPTRRSGTSPIPARTGRRSKAISTIQIPCALSKSFRPTTRA